MDGTIEQLQVDINNYMEKIRFAAHMSEEFYQPCKRICCFMLALLNDCYYEVDCASTDKIFWNYNILSIILNENKSITKASKFLFKVIAEDYNLSLTDKEIQTINENRLWEDFRTTYIYYADYWNIPNVEQELDDLRRYFNGIIGGLKQQQQIFNINYKQILSNIYNHFLTKKNSYNESDLDILITALSLLDMDPDFFDRLKKHLAAHVKEKTSISNNEVKPFIKITNKELLSSDERKQLNQQLKQYYNIETQELIRPLSIKEVISCVVILKKLKQSDNVISRFLKLARSENNQQNVIAQYYYVIDKLKYYAQNLNIENQVRELEDYFQEYNHCVTEEKDIWLEILVNLLNDLKILIPNDGIYENEKARALIIN